VEDRNLRLEFHRALDAVAPPAPWLAETVREENRRRRRMARPARGGRSRLGLTLAPAAQRLIAAALILVLAATVAAAAVAIYSETHRVIPVVPHASGPVSRQCAYMVDPNVGWQGTQRTMDGGKTWHDVSPPSEPGAVKGGGAFCAFDGSHAWATYGTGPGPYQPDHIVVMLTGDGGQTWQEQASIPIGFSVDWRINLSIDLDFFDLQHGWLLIEYRSKPVVRKVLATSDGGVHWIGVNRAADLGIGDTASGCPESGLMFASLKVGWLTWDCATGSSADQPPAAGPAAAYTNDAGVTWKSLNLPAYPIGSDWQCLAKPPVFSGLAGMIEVACVGVGHPGWNAVYSTADMGQTWAVHPVPVTVTLDFVSGTVGFYFSQAVQSGPNTLYRTQDSGSHWTAVATNLFPGKGLSGLTFIDERVGFVSDGESPAAWWTHDGGKTWSLPAPYRSVGSTVCALFSDPGANSSLPKGVKMVSSSVGWATGTRRTTDGGSTWTSVAPPVPKDRSYGYGEFFLDATHAWVVDSAGSATACADHFVVYRTANGGAKWQQIASVPIQNAIDISIEFLDSQTGWIYVHLPGYLAGGSPGPLYRTLDGGMSWTVVGAKASWSSGACSSTGLPVFSSPTTGWMPTICTDTTRSSMDLLVTRDGGQTWTSQELIKHWCDLQAYPDGCVIAGPGPQFLDASNGWILDTNGPTLLMTTDGGGTWVRHGLPRVTSYSCQGKYGPTTCTNQYVMSLTFISPAEGWLILGDYPGSGNRVTIRVERTVDSGHSWAVLYTLNASTQDDVTGSLTFVDPSNGFWWVGSNLLRTSDGGHTWTSVHVTYS
jgi:photosystem II stability/assembly factor-like uncharacterized protein